MEPRKLTRADIDRVRGTDGFPIGTDEDIIELSDAPWYTACPNPFLPDFIRENGRPYDEATDDYRREPFAWDVSEGKTDPLYNAHTYHTKVPHRAIMRYILHYTNPGDIVFDGFCGSGMTGVAAHMCACPDPELQYRIEKELPRVQWGDRTAVLSDLSPVATFLSSNFNNPVSASAYEKEATRIISECESEFAWMYETAPTNRAGQISLYEKGEKGRINYVVWSDVFICPQCGNEIIFWDVAVDSKTGKVKDAFRCPECNAKLTKRDCERARDIRFDSALGKNVEISKQTPCLINYTLDEKRRYKTPDAADLALLEKIDGMTVPYWFPTDELPDGINTAQPKNANGIHYVHQFYTKRTLIVLSAFFDKARRSSMPHEMLMLFTGVLQICTKMSSFRYDSRNPQNTAGGILKGTLYIPSLSKESYVIDNLRRRLTHIMDMRTDVQKISRKTLISTQSAAAALPSDSIDYIFTDPPFGANINYSELNCLWEAWLKVKTNNRDEAIINKVQGKELAEYQNTMTRCFQNYYRVLKPNRWITVEFHNSKNAVWNAIQEAMQKSGFIIADVRTLDKRQGTFKQMTTTSAVKQDLVISAYKPKNSFLENLRLEAGTEESAWSFVRQRLENLPVAPIRQGQIEVVAERQAYLLFDRMVAYHITQGLPVTLDAGDFYRGLDERFLNRDGMYFLPDQVNEYDTARMKADVKPIQFDLFVTNEKSAIAWLYLQLETPQTYAELQPKFMREAKATDRYERIPELSVMLEENFLQDERGLWYIPDTAKESDIAKLREKKLWKEFEGYLNSRGKLKLFRSEAIRAGFSRLWKEKRYQEIVNMADRLPERTIQDDQNLLMYYDASMGKL